MLKHQGHCILHFVSEIIGNETSVISHGPGKAVLRDNRTEAEEHVVELFELMLDVNRLASVDCVVRARTVSFLVPLATGGQRITSSALDFLSLVHSFAMDHNFAFIHDSF